MIITRTILVVGDAGGAELELPGGREMLNRLAQGFDFVRLGGELQTQDMVCLARHFENLAPRLGASAAQLRDSAGAIRIASRIGTSIEAVLDQLAHDRLALAAGKLALAYFVLQAEARSPLAREPREPGDLPLRGSENWLFQLARWLVNACPRDEFADSCANLTIINFNQDRALQHYLPWAVALAYAMPVAEARERIGAQLRIVHPLGRAGRLPWEAGDAPAADWGEGEAAIHDLALHLRTPREALRDPQLLALVRAEIAAAGRVVFLGFGFERLANALLADGALACQGQIIAGVGQMPENQREAIGRAVRRLAGGGKATDVLVQDVRPYQLLRDNALLLES